MDATCINCEQPATKQCRIRFGAGPSLENEPICPACFAFFRQAKAIEVAEVST